MALMDFFRRKSSGDVAKDRLKLLLISDRANCSPEVMELIKNDIIKVISKYTQTESEGENGRVPALCANIPIKELKHSSEKK